MKKMFMITVAVLVLLLGGLAADTHNKAEARPPIGM